MMIEGNVGKEMMKTFQGITMETFLIFFVNISKEQEEERVDNESMIEF